MASIRFYQDLSTNRPAASSDYNGAVFFTTDTHEIQLCNGSDWVPYGGKVKFVPSLPSSGADLTNAEQGILYVDASGAAGFSTGTPATWVAVSSGSLTKDSGIPATNASTTNVPTTAAVRSAIDAAVANVPTLTNGKLDSSVIPYYALSELISGGPYADLTELVAAFAGNNPPRAELGDYIVTQDNILYILSANDGDETSDWTPVATPNTYTGTNGVTVNGNVISGTTYADGDGISISGANNTIAVDLIADTGLAIDSTSHKLKGVAATTTVLGMMSAADKIKLDSIASGANNYILPKAGASGESGAAIGGVMVDNSSIKIDGNGVISVEWKSFPAN